MKYKSFLLLVLLAMFAGCQSTTSAPTTVDEFSTAFRNAYDLGDQKAISNMFDWTGVDDELQKIQLSIVTMFLGENKIKEISVVPFDPKTPGNPVNGREIEPNITPTHMLTFSHQGNSGFEGGESSGSASMPLGKKNGKYYFCGWTYKKR